MFDEVTARLAEKLELDVSRQRLDSTHVFSHMATFGRTKLMAVAIKRFLTQVRRHASERYEALPQEFRQRYEPAESHLFSGVKDVQLITAALPETACKPDGAALSPILEQLQKGERLPEELLADTTYGSDENVQAAASGKMRAWVATQVARTPGPRGFAQDGQLFGSIISPLSHTDGFWGTPMFTANSLNAYRRRLNQKITNERRLLSATSDLRSFALIRGSLPVVNPSALHMLRTPCSIRTRPI